VAFSSTGYLPVLPGPCTVLRISDIGYSRDGETPITHYFNTINVPMEQSNIVLENVKLAEDRIPSYSIITHNREKVYSTWVNGAIFKSQSEVTIKDLLFQRRRWINGSFYCTVWNLFVNPEYIWKSNMGIIKRIFILFMLLLQFLNNIFSVLFTAFITISLYFSLDVLNVKHPYILTIVISYNILVLLFCWIHKYFKFSKPLVSLFIVLNIVCLIIVTYGYIHKIIYYHKQWVDIFFMCILIFVVLVPFIVILFSLKIGEFIKLLLYFIPYVLFLPTLLGTFTLYAYARSYDVSWGNRVDNTEITKNVQEDISGDSATILMFVNIINIVLAFCVINYGNKIGMLILILIIIAPLVIQSVIVLIVFLFRHITCK
jgi:chitin synthase